MNKLRLYSFKEWVHILVNFIFYKIEKQIDKNIVRKKALFDSYILNGWKIRALKNNYLLTKKDVKISLRKNSTDYLVFEQIFIGSEYQPIIDYCQNIGCKIITMFDLGANIGLSSIYFNQFFPDIHICAVEPYGSNISAMRHNYKLNNLNIFIVQGAVWHNTSNLGISRDFRDGKEWSISVSDSSPNTDIQGYTMAQLMEMSNFETIDFLKVDIEGAERFIFDESISDVSFLEKVKIIALEIHDEFGMREKINNTLIKYGFEIKINGELTIGFKQHGTI
ncbi:MAG: FkbM family methyltransferase [Bacteroidales bacterium]|nr:FkbM family methyltransferase [Bacteroidales bacterium]